MAQPSNDRSLQRMVLADERGSEPACPELGSAAFSPTAALEAEHERVTELWEDACTEGRWGTAERLRAKMTALDRAIATQLSRAAVGENAVLSDRP